MTFEENTLIPYAEMSENLKGFFAILNAGSDAPRILNSVREIVEKEARNGL